MGELLLAVDIGNSKTDLVVLDGARAVHHVRTGSLTPVGRGAAATAAALADLVRGLGVEVAASWLAVAGVDFPDQEAELAAALARHPELGECVVANDVHALLHCVPGARIAVVLGAGANAVGVAEDRLVRFAALGELSGDLGGGGFVGRQALVAASRAADGRGPATGLVGVLTRHFGQSGMDQLSRALFEGRLDPGRLGEVVPAVFDLARAGDEVALELVHGQAREAAVFVRATANRLGVLVSAAPIVLGGSVLRHGRDLVEDEVRRQFPGDELDLRFPDFPPVVGAAVAVLGSRGIEVPAEAVAIPQANWLITPA